MQQPYNFQITSSKNISSHFLSRNICDFSGAINFVKQLPYGRNANKNDLGTLFIDNCGTCSTKHALLKELATENEMKEVKLVLAIFKMNATNTPAVETVLLKNNLEYIPEAHNYLLVGNEYVDCTTLHSSKVKFENDLITEIEIETVQITDYKIQFHKEYLEQWLEEQKVIKLSLDEIWMIREKCIEALSGNSH